MRAYKQNQNQPQDPVSSSLARPNMATPGGHRGHPLLHLARTIGNQAAQRLFQQPKPDGLEASSGRHEVTHFSYDFSQVPVHSKSSATVLAKLTASLTAGIYEQEAGRISERMMRTPNAESGLSPTVTRLHRAPLDLDMDPWQPDEEEARRVATETRDGTPASRELTESSAHGAPFPLPRELGVSSPGEPMPTAVRAGFEARFGRDLSSVRVHSGPDAARSALSLNARAYTAGSHVVFGEDQYSPGSHTGRALLAHELTHVVQQAGARGSHGRTGSGMAVQRDKLATIPRTSVRDRIAELKAQETYALGGGDIPVLEFLAALQRAVTAPKNKPAEITKAVDAFLEAVDAHPLEAATQSLIGGDVGDDIAQKLAAKGLPDEADRILTHFHSPTSSYELTNISQTTTSYPAKATGYIPNPSKMEGGLLDRLGNPLHTLQDFQAGKAPFVSVAMDTKGGPPFGTRLNIDEFPGVVFRVVDTGGAFKGTGLTRIDICTANEKASQDPKVNGLLHLHFPIPLPYYYSPGL
jgi:hypothetical protein